MNSNPMPNTTKSSASGAFRLIRSADEAKVGGICAGLAATAGIDVGALRFLVAVICVLHPPVALFYLVGWMLLPALPTRLTEPASGDTAAA